MGENVTVSFALPFLDFYPETVTTVYEIKTQGMVALRARLPPKSPLYSVLHSLLKYASFSSTSPTIEDLPTVLHLAQVIYSSFLSYVNDYCNLSLMRPISFLLFSCFLSLNF